jgi:hypothetical protein
VTNHGLLLHFKPGYAPLFPRKLLYRDSKVASGKLVPRYCASWLRLNFCTVIQKWSHFTLYCDRASSQSNLYPDGKNCAMLRSLRLLWNCHHSQDGVIASIRLSTTNDLYCRTVSGHESCIYHTKTS